MKHIFAITLFALSFFQANAQKLEIAAIQEVIQEAYVDGIFNVGYMRSIDLSFSDHFESIGLLENDVTVVETIQDWKEMVRQNIASGKYPLPPNEQVTVKYLNIEISRTVANVKLEFSQGGTPKYIDFLALYKFEGGWKIVNRTYHSLEIKE